MALNQMGLGFLFTAKDEASAVMGKLERTFGSFGNKSKAMMASLMQGALGTGVMLGGVAALRKEFSLAKEAGEFQQALVDIKSISGATTAELKALEVSAIEAGIATQFSPQEAVGGLRDLAAAGYNAQDSIKLLSPALDLAAGSLGELNPQAAAGVAAQTLKAFGLSADDASLAMDKLLATSNLFAVQTKELPELIGHIVRGSASFGASLSESLASVGLARNVLGNIELASTGVSVAMERLIKSDVQRALKGMGVDVVNASGGFNQFLDILTQMTNSPAFNRLNEAGKADFIQNVFGHHALGAVNAILTQLNGGIKTMTGETVKGAQAVSYLRDQFANAAGTAKKFAEARLDTLPGQLKLLEGSVQTLGIVVGRELASIFRPVVEGVLNTVNTIMEAWLKLPQGVRSGIAKFAVALTVLATAFGGLIAAKATVVVLVGVLGKLGLTLGSLFAGVGPVAGALLALAGVSYLVYRAYKANFGGLADYVGAAWAKISLAVRGLGQLFSEGALSGAIMKELGKAENGGVKSFVISLFMWGARVKNFFEGIAGGFKSMGAMLEPVFKELLGAFDELGSMLGLSVGKAEDNAEAFDKFGEAGRDLGKVLAAVLSYGITILTWAIRALTIVVGAGKDAWALYGSTVGSVFQIIGGALQVLFGILSGNGDLFWNGFVNLTIGSVKTIMNSLMGMVKTFAYVVDWLNEKTGLSDYRWLPQVQAEQADMIGQLNDSAAVLKNPAYGYGALANDQGAQYRAGLGSASGLPVGVSGATPAAAASAEGANALQKALEEALRKTQASQARTLASPPQETKIYLDGELLATAMFRANMSIASRSYEPVPAGGAE